jgi:alanine racemase
VTRSASASPAPCARVLPTPEGTISTKNLKLIVKTRKRRRSPFRIPAVATRPTVAEIDLGALADNFSAISRKVGRNVVVMPVVKANAYGHGIREVAVFLEGIGARYFGVATAEEGKALRESGIRSPIHVFALPGKSQIPLYFDFRLEPTVCTEAEIGLLEAEARRRRSSVDAHLKIDTGMNRIGAKLMDMKTVLKRLGRCSGIHLKGAYTHFATADEPDKSFLQKQLGEFDRGLEILEREQVQVELAHCANSGAIIDEPRSYKSMVRPGIMLYGYYPSQATSESVRVRPSMTLRSALSMTKRIGAGETVSYGRRFVATRPTWIGTIPVGYADGYTRLLTHKARVLVRSREFPIAGTICMDQCMVDLGETRCRAGDEVVLIGRQGNKRISGWDLASHIGTIPYEILCAISERVPRIYKKP